MMVEIDTTLIVTVIIAGFAAHYVVMTLAINYAVAKLGKVIAEDYSTKDDLIQHVKELHK